jgi:hypothetical protein
LDEQPCRVDLGLDVRQRVRDGLELAQEPFDNRWGVWSVTGVSLLDDLQDLIELKLAQLAKRAG